MSTHIAYPTTSITPARLRAAAICIHNAISRQRAMSGARQLVSGFQSEDDCTALIPTYQHIAGERGVHIEVEANAIWLTSDQFGR